MKLEDDEDVTMHSAVDVEAFTAALNRDVEGDNNNTFTSRASNSDAGVLPHGSNPAFDQLLSQWINFSLEGNISHIKQEELNNSQLVEQHSSEMEFRQHGSGSDSQMQELGYSHDQNKLSLQQKDNQLQQQAEHNSHHFTQNAVVQVSEQKIINFPEQDRMRHPDNLRQNFNLQNMNNQQGSTSDSTNNPMTGQKQVPFDLLFPVIAPHLGKDRSMQLQTLYYSKLRKNEITKIGFIRLMRDIVGDQMLRQAVNTVNMERDKLQATRNQQTGSQHLHAQSQSSLQSQQQVKMPSLGATQWTDSHSFSQLHQKDQDRMRHPDNHQQSMSNQQGSTSDSTNNPMIRNNLVPFSLLVPVIIAQLDKDRAMQLQTLCSIYRKNEITQDGFKRLMRSIVGDEMLRQTAKKLYMQHDKRQATQNPQTGSQRLLAQSQSSLRSQQVKMQILGRLSVRRQRLLNSKLKIHK